MKSRGYTNNEIAKETTWPSETVKSLSKSTCAKLHAKNMPNAVWIAIQRGILG